MDHSLEFAIYNSISVNLTKEKSATGSWLTVRYLTVKIDLTRRFVGLINLSLDTSVFKHYLRFFCSNKYDKKLQCCSH